uniref:Uncharacterized protein n=1 Tax=Gouania willdenowi TaxID=441366 RepID=A0A8C5EH31_GOUWI
MAWQEQGSFSSFEEWVSNSQLQRGEENEAPKADPEEDIDILEPGAEVSFLQENQGISIITIIDATIMELAGNTQSKPEEVTQNIPRQTEKTEEEPEECVDLCDDEFPPPPSLDSNQICEIKETPIEREIRRHLEREHSLRRARGLPCPPTSPLFVEIPLRINGPVQPLPAKAEQNQDKDREFAGKMMQHEIHGEIQREQDLVKLGKVPGVYDKGTVRQIKERKLIFETFQTRSDSTLSTPMKSKASSWSSDSKVSSPENQGNLPKQASPIEGSSTLGRTISINNRQLKQFSQLTKPRQMQYDLYTLTIFSCTCSRFF